jgi:hypothetical protein
MVVTPNKLKQTPKALPSLANASLAPLAVAAEATEAAKDAEIADLEAALQTVSNPKAKAMILAALKEARETATKEVIDPDAVPTLFFWLAGEGKTRKGYMTNAWRPGKALYGSATEPATYRGAMQGNGTWQQLPMTNGSEWGYWHGPAVLMHAAVTFLQGQGWDVVQVADIHDAEAKAAEARAAAPKVRVADKGRGKSKPAASTVPVTDASKALDLSGFRKA